MHTSVWTVQKHITFANTFIHKAESEPVRPSVCVTQTEKQTYFQHRQNIAPTVWYFKNGSFKYTIYWCMSKHIWTLLAWGCFSWLSFHSFNSGKSYSTQRYSNKTTACSLFLSLSWFSMTIPLCTNLGPQRNGFPSLVWKNSDWPAQLPDLNLNQHISAELERKFITQHPQLTSPISHYNWHNNALFDVLLWFWHWSVRNYTNDHRDQPATPASSKQVQYKITNF